MSEASCGRPRLSRRRNLPISLIAVAALALAAAGCGGHSASGPARIVLPRVLIGLPRDTSPDSLAAAQEGLSAQKSVFSLYQFIGGQDPGKYTSALAANWATDRPGAPYRYVDFVGFDGKFKTAPAFNALENVDSVSLSGPSPFRTVAPGPRGGKMACEVQAMDTVQCAWASATTIGDLLIEDTSGELTRDTGAAAAVSIRDALVTAQ